MAIDIFNPEVSQVIKGIPGKLICIYGTNGTGKTSNMVKADKPFVIAFENGLGAISGIANTKIKRWTDFQKVVKQFTDPATIDEAKKHYSTIIIDTIDGIENLADPYIAGCYGVTRVREGNEGYGLWKEYSAEINKQINLLCNSGYTVVFLAHEGDREFPNPQGEKYTMIYPRGDKRVVNPILDLCDIVAYAQLQPDSADGKPVPSTLYLRGNSAFLAKSRFKYMVRSIPEWSYEKLEKAVVDAITMEEKASGVASTTLEASLAKEEAETKAEAEAMLPIDELIQRIGMMLKQMNAKNGNINEYSDLLLDKLGTKDFKCNTATEAQREQVETIYYALMDKGYKFDSMGN